jgi:hypothetical protein
MAMFMFAKFRVQKTTTIKCVRAYLGAPKGLNKYLTTRRKKWEKGNVGIVIEIS